MVGVLHKLVDSTKLTLFLTKLQDVFSGKYLAMDNGGDNGSIWDKVMEGYYVFYRDSMTGDDYAPLANTTNTNLTFGGYNSREGGFFQPILPVSDGEYIVRVPAVHKITSAATPSSTTYVRGGDYLIYTGTTNSVQFILSRNGFTYNCGTQKFLCGVAVIKLTTGNSPNITFSCGDSNDSVEYYSNYSIAANKSYEINIIYNGSKFTIANAVVG